MSELWKWLSMKAEDALRLLLEKKHLYQSVTLNRAELKSEAEGFETADNVPLDAAIDLALDSKWYAHDEISIQRIGRFGEPSIEDVPLSIGLYVDFIKTSCSTCETVMPFNLVSAVDVYRPQSHGFVRSCSEQQDFLFFYECQSCKSAPDSFLVRRRREKRTLCGRAPIEFVEVPRYVPKEMRRYFSGAVVAFQSGQTLAGLFLLRVLIEQFARSTIRKDGKKGALKADEVLQEYAAGLPVDFKSRFPSLRETYATLSKAIHAAEDSSTVFNESLASIDRHFDARRVFEI